MGDAEPLTDPTALATAVVEAIASLVGSGRSDLAVWLRRMNLIRVDFSTHPAGAEIAEAVLSGPPDAAAALAQYIDGSERTVEDAFSFPSADVVLLSIDKSAMAAEPTARLQGTLYPGPGPITHNGLRYRSNTEVRVARALDEAGVLYFPLPVASRSRVTREPDFVVVHLGRVGVLEIDGPHHTPLTRADEDRKAAWFEKSGVRLYRHYPVTQVDSDVQGVVREFLTDLRGPTL